MPGCVPNGEEGDGCAPNGELAWVPKAEGDPNGDVVPKPDVAGWAANGDVEVVVKADCCGLPQAFAGFEEKPPNPEGAGVGEPVLAENKLVALPNGLKSVVLR